MGKNMSNETEKSKLACATRGRGLVRRTQTDSGNMKLITPPPPPPPPKKEKTKKKKKEEKKKTKKKKKKKKKSQWDLKKEKSAT